MRRLASLVMVSALAAAAPVAITPRDAVAQERRNRAEPSVGYVFPAGGQRGTTFHVLAGGQGLRGISDAYVTGSGVRVTVQHWVRPLNPMQMRELRRRLADAAAARRDPDSGTRGLLGAGGVKADPEDLERVELPDHPMLRDLDKKTPREIRELTTRFLGVGEKRQANTQIAETVDLEVTIDPGAAAGEREIRFATPAGLTNPLRFHVGALPEVREEEPAGRRAPAAPAVALPVVVNGQILPGDVDRVRFRARRGQRLVIDVRARRLIPFLADAVPGWFQATAALFDAKGSEVAFADDYRWEPDPVLLVAIPSDGDYVLEIEDALFRGREDFVYRVSIGEEPFILRMFPLGVRAGSVADAAVTGWNLPGPTVPFDTRAGAGSDAPRFAAARRGERLSNGVPYAVDDLPEEDEVEPASGDEARGAQRIALPRIVNGRIDRPGDFDTFTFEGRAGDEVVAEVEARRLSSPLDSVVTLVDPEGRVVAWNDDHADGSAGLLTHRADSYLRAHLAADGVHRVRIGDAQRHGGPDHAYRLRIGPPRPGFRVLATPSGLSVAAGRTVPFRVHAMRADGFDGDISLRLVEPPAGFVLAGGRIPAGSTSTRVTLTAPADALEAPAALRVEAVATIGGAEVVRGVVPADDRMQAFLWRHLVPARELLVAVTLAGRGATPGDVAGAGPVRLVPGGTATVRIRTARRVAPDDVRFELDEPPAGVTIASVSADPVGLAIVLRADAATAKPGTADNLIVEAFATSGGGRRGADGGGSRSLGYLPAIPVEIVAR